MSPRIGRAAGSLLPILVIYLSILILVPYGRLLSQSLYRLWPETIETEVALPAPAESLAPLPTGTAVCGEGRLWWLAEGAEPVEVEVGPCEHLGFHKMTDVLAVRIDGGRQLVRVDLGEDVPRMKLLPTGASVLDAFSVGRRIAAATQDGRVIVWDEGRERRDLALGSEPVSAVYPAGDTLLAAQGSELVQVGTDGGLRVLHRFDVGAPIHTLARIRDRVLVATAGEVLSLRSPPDGARPPRIIDRAPLPAPATRIHIFLPTATAIALALEGGGVHILREDGASNIWWGVQGGVRLECVDCAGSWGQIRCIHRDGRLLELDRYPSRDALIVSVGILGVLAVIGLLVGSIAAGRGAMLRRIGVSLAALGGLGWLLSGTYKNPIESLHVLEYGAIGVLTYRALCREFGGGWAAASLTVVAGFAFGLGDETFQAVFPSRTGSMEDVWLDTQAVSLGAVFAWAGLGLGEGRPRLAVWPLPVAVGVMVLAGAAFLTFAQGFSTTWSEGALRWTSRLSPEQTLRVDGSGERSPELERAVLMDYGDYLRAFEDDPFLYELRVRLFRRDKRAERGDLAVACGEQAVLDRLFPRTVARTSFAWSADQRAICTEFEGRAYASPVGEDRITWASPWSLWLGAAGLALLAFLGGIGLARRAPPRSP